MFVERYVLFLNGLIVDIQEFVERPQRDVRESGEVCMTESRESFRQVSTDRPARGIRLLAKLEVAPDRRTAANLDH